MHLLIGLHIFISYALFALSHACSASAGQSVLLFWLKSILSNYRHRHEEKQVHICLRIINRVQKNLNTGGGKVVPCFGFFKRKKVEMVVAL